MIMIMIMIPNLILISTTIYAFTIPPIARQRLQCNTLFNRYSGLSMNNKIQSNLDKMRKVLSQIEDDGYTKSHKGPSKRTRITSWVRGIVEKVTGTVQPGYLILVRHGESTWNSNKTFTGWVDVDLSDRGVREIEHAARLLLEQGFTVDIAYTSRLKRAIRSTWILLRELNQIFRPVFKSYRLNERMYGALEGLSKPQMASELGAEVVQSWRSGLLARPPKMNSDHKHWHQNERKYSDLAPEDIPVTESLQDTMERTLPLWDSRILPELLKGNNVLLVAHGNSLRGIVKHIDKLNMDEIQSVGIPNGIPLVYKFNKKMEPIIQSNAVAPLSGEFLEKKGLLRAALSKEAELAKNVPGYEIPDGNSSLYSRPQLDPKLLGLTKLDQEMQLVEMAMTGSTKIVTQRKDSFDDDEAVKKVSAAVSSGNLVIRGNPIRVPASQGSLLASKNFVVIIRHGKTEYNKLGLFTGWEDAPLAKEGVQEAINAGQLLNTHGVQFDVVYTSWLSRAIETAWLVLDQLDSVWLPIIKSWRLNERMYGALTGMSKKMVGQRHGEKQLKIWRRGYDTRPPSTSSFSHDYPGNDDRYVKYVKDVRISVFESFIRSLAHGRLELHRKFPKTESLKDCMDRTIPYFKNVIYPESIEKGQCVLIASSENAIRGLLMHLCDIPTDVIHKVEIPTGLPLVYDFETKCIKLLDDGSYAEEDPLQRYNFGSAPELLFLPRTMRAGKGTFRSLSEAEGCYIADDGQVYCCDPLIRLPLKEEALISDAASSSNAVVSEAPNYAQPT